MKLLYCPQCGDLVQMRPEPRSCLCGASSGHYLADLSTVEQTEGSVSIALHNHDLKTAMRVFADKPADWHPLFCFRAYLNPHSEPDVRYVPSTPEPAGEQGEEK